MDAALASDVMRGTLLQEGEGWGWGEGEGNGDGEEWGRTGRVRWG